MRMHALAVAAIAVTFLAGCTGESGSSTAAPTPAVTASTTAGTPADTALSQDTEAICDQAGRTSADFGRTFAEDYRLLIQAAAESEQAKAKAQEEVAKDMASFSFALLDLSKLASDLEVKKALAAMGAQVTALKGDVSKVDDKLLAELRSVLDKACGRG